MNDNRQPCPICGDETHYVGDAGYYTRDRQFGTPMFFCDSCDAYVRTIDDTSRNDHFYAASYVQLANEDSFFRQRVKFFEHILGIALRHCTPPPGKKPILIDFGSAYGHQLKVAKDLGFEAFGVELNRNLVSYCRDQGLAVFESLGEVGQTADVVTLIDSLYCVSNPKEILGDVRRHLAPGGLLVVRITNRNQIARLLLAARRPKALDVLGDATVSYSVRAIKRLLHRTGFDLLEVVPEAAKGKKMAFNLRVLYALTYLLTVALANSIVLTPGVIVVARRRE